MTSSMFRAAVLVAFLFPPLAARAEMHHIEIVDGAFAPDVLTARTGDVLRVVNRNGVPHTFTAGDGSFDSGRLMDGDVTQLVLSEVGVQTFRCTLGGQQVRVTVEASRGAVHHGGAASP